jgi:GcrA cell cycle regulator
MRPCGLIELSAGRCRFPVGDPGDPGFFYCGGDATRDKPYCAYHCAIAYTAPLGPRSTAKKSALTELWR